MRAGVLEVCRIYCRRSTASMERWMAFCARAIKVAEERGLALAFRARAADFFAPDIFSWNSRCGLHRGL